MSWAQPASHAGDVLDVVVDQLRCNGALLDTFSLGIGLRVKICSLLITLRYQSWAFSPQA